MNVCVPSHKIVTRRFSYRDLQYGEYLNHFNAFITQENGNLSRIGLMGHSSFPVFASDHFIGVALPECREGVTRHVFAASPSSKMSGHQPDKEQGHRPAHRKLKDAASPPLDQLHASKDWIPSYSLSNAAWGHTHAHTRSNGFSVTPTGISVLHVTFSRC